MSRKIEIIQTIAKMNGMEDKKDSKNTKHKNSY